MIKKYGLNYVVALISAIFVSFMFPISLFLIYMFKDEKDEAKAGLVKKLKLMTYTWIILDIVALIAKLISTLIGNGTI